MANQLDPPIRRKLVDFSIFLLGYKCGTSRGAGTYFRSGTAAQYISALKTKLFNRFRPLRFGLGRDDPEWCDDICRSLKMRATAAAIARGDIVAEKAVGVARQTIIEMSKHLMDQADESLGYEERAVLTTLYHAVGRGGEVSASTWDSSYWELDREHFVLDWGEVKIGVQHIMTFHPDATFCIK
mmetsp:Transcript_12653/g.18593  ORF Transcript_12653/g.18593 Transcript_12653/m.18593 type:complete len:184 (-) Transcript_12653:11-562(-)